MGFHHIANWRAGGESAHNSLFLYTILFNKINIQRLNCLDSLWIYDCSQAIRGWPGSATGPEQYWCKAKCYSDYSLEGLRQTVPQALESGFFSPSVSILGLIEVVSSMVVRSLRIVYIISPQDRRRSQNGKAFDAEPCQEYSHEITRYKNTATKLRYQLCSRFKGS